VRLAVLNTVSDSEQVVGPGLATITAELIRAVAYLVEALRCKAEGSGLDSVWSQWDFSLM
jgi:Na+-driven multidrug efflux pump